MITKTKLKPEISVINVILCLLVVWIHVSSAPVTGLTRGSWQFAMVFFPWRLSTFVVQGFIFLSGLKLFINNPEKLNYRKFYRSRFTKIIIPYLLWNLIYYVYFIQMGYYTFSLPDLVKYIFNGTLVSPFYFIVVLVQYYALAPVWNKIIRKRNPVVVLILSAVISLFLGQYLPDIIAMVVPNYQFPYTDRVFTTYLIYWMAGSYAGLYYDKFKEMIRNSRIFIFAAFLVFTLSDAIVGYISYTGQKDIIWLEDIHFFYCISAILFLFSVFLQYYESRELKNRLVKEIDKASYYIFLVHCLIIFIVNEVMASLGIRGILPQYLIRILAVYSLSISLCILWNKLKKHVGIPVNKNKQVR